MKWVKFFEQDYNYQNADLNDSSIDLEGNDQYDDHLVEEDMLGNNRFVIDFVMFLMSAFFPHFHNANQKRFNRFETYWNFFQSIIPSRK